MVVAVTTVRLVLVRPADEQVDPMSTDVAPMKTSATAADRSASRTSPTWSRSCRSVGPWRSPPPWRRPRPRPGVRSRRLRATLQNRSRTPNTPDRSGPSRSGAEGHGRLARETDLQVVRPSGKGEIVGGVGEDRTSTRASSTAEPDVDIHGRGVRAEMHDTDLGLGGGRRRIVLEHLGLDVATAPWQRWCRRYRGYGDVASMTGAKLVPSRRP